MHVDECRTDHPSPIRNAIEPEVPLVAIVTPVFNGAAYLAETMDCVQALDHPRLVHVVLDNASTDATAEIIARYADARVPVVTQRNPSTIPLVDNFNAAVRLVPREARYFRLLCADDTMPPDAITKQVAVAERDPAIGIVGCLCRGGGVSGTELPRDREVFDGLQIARGLLRREHTAFTGCEVLIRTTELDRHAPFFEPDLPCMTDKDANLRACLSGRAGFVHEVLAFRREHENNAFKAHKRWNHSTLDWLKLLDRYGRTVLDEAEYREYRDAYRRHYLRQLLLVRWRHGDRTIYDWHMANLERSGERPGWLAFAGALAEWSALVLTGRHGAGGLPWRSSRR